MQCLRKYHWVKLPRERMPEGKGIMGYWARLASCCAYRKGRSLYCGYENHVEPGMWAGGIAGLKSILRVKSRTQALQILQELSDLQYLTYKLDEKTKKLEYHVTDWVLNCSGNGCMDGAVYATSGYGFLCMPRNITNRLAENKRIFDEADAWLDLWSHTVYKDRNNVFSFEAPIVQYGKFKTILTLETLGQRWGWEKTKVWRFFQKHGDVFSLHRLPSSYGCLIFNKCYPADNEIILPDQDQIMHIITEVRNKGVNAHKYGTEHEHLNRLISWYSKKMIPVEAETQPVQDDKDRVALLCPITRAYLSHCKNCQNCNYDCNSRYYSIPEVFDIGQIRGPCEYVDLDKLAKEIYGYE